MPKFGAHACLWVDQWTTEKGNHAIREAAAGGFDFIEIPLLKPHEFDAASHRRALREAGLEATASVVLPPEAHMPFYPEKAKAFLVAAMDKLIDIGGSTLCGCIAYNLGTLTGCPPTGGERQVVVDTVREVAAEARTRGITLGFECCNRYETYLYNTLADGREAIVAIGVDNLMLHADTYHMNIEEEGFYTPLIACADVLGYIHMSESHRGLVGSGTVSWEQVFSGLADSKYSGPLVLESFAGVNPDMMAATRMWRAPKHPSSVLAAEGLEYLRAQARLAGLV